MSASKYYGSLTSERLADENYVVREIVREINNFGVNDKQRWLIAYLLGLELEDIDDLKAFTNFIKERKGDVIFLSGKDTEKDG